jgi:membrane protein
MWSGSYEIFALLSSAIAFAVIASLFALIYKVLPEAPLSWADVGIGAIFTAILFTLGKYAIGLYLGRGAIASSFGAAGSIVALLLWVYYSALILLFGAEFTETWAERRGQGIVPEPGAVRVRREKQRVGELGPTT